MGIESEVHEWLRAPAEDGLKTLWDVRALITVLALSCFASLARADHEAEIEDADTEAESGERHGPGGYAWAEAAVFVEQNRGPNVTSISPLIGAEYWIRELVEVRARFGWSGVRISGSARRCPAPESRSLFGGRRDARAHS